MQSAPKAPDPAKTAAAQTQMNKDTAIAQQQLNMVDQTTPYGSLTYTQTGTYEDGTPKFSATQTLSPENQQLYDQYMGIAGQLGQIGNTQAGNVASTMGQPFDFDAAQATKLTDMQNTFLDPQWQRQESSLEAKLMNQGVNPGTEAYRRAMEEFSTNRQRAYDQNYLSAYDTAGRQALTERNQPLNELSAMLSGSQVRQPGYASTPQTGVSGVDYAGLVNQNYQNETANYQNKMGGLFGLGGSVLGGWAKTGFAMPSDRRLKRDISRVGKLDNGLNVYSYRYKSGGPMQIGVMADEVREVNPSAVVEVDGIQMVDYNEAVR